MLTAAHIVKRTIDGESDVHGAYITRKSKDFNTILGVDLAFVHFDSKAAENPYPVCDSASGSKLVVAYGVVDLKKGVEKVNLKVDRIFLDTIYLIGRLPRGFSGGPVVDEDKGCVIGLIFRGPETGVKFVKAVNLTDDDWK